MALIKCPDCGKDVSDVAPACPTCGRPVVPPTRTVPAKKTSPLAWGCLIVIIAVVGLMILGGLLSGGKHTTVSPSKESEASVPPVAKPAAPGSQWVYTDEADKMGRGSVKTATVQSSNEIAFDFPYTGAQRAGLELRRHPKYGNDVILFIEKGQFLCGLDDCTVSVRFDEEKPQAYHATEPADHSTTVLFLSNYEGFVAKARRCKKVAIEAQFYQQGTKVFEFNIEGLKW